MFMKVSKSTKKKTKPLTAEEFDAKFDRGDDMSEHVDWEQAQKFVYVPFPVWMIAAMDDEAKRLGINRQALIKVWVADCIERGKAKRPAVS
jgi:hypothetical protein